MQFNAIKRMQTRDRKKYQQSFDKDKITIKKAGKEYNVYDKIQAEREDTEIYPTLEKYGCLDKIKLNEADLFVQWGQYNDLRSLQDQQIKAKEMWDGLPAEIRQEFENNMYKFVETGEEWLKNRVLEQEKQKGIQPIPVETQETKATTNE